MPQGNYFDELEKRLTPAPTPTPVGTDQYFASLEGKLAPPDPVHVLSPTELASDIGKGVGLGIVRSLTNTTAYLHDILWKHDFLKRTVVGAIVPGGSAVGDPLLEAGKQINTGATNAAVKNRTELRTGALSPNTQADLQKRSTIAWGTNLGPTGSVLPEVLSSGPDFVGQTVGALPMNAATFGASSTLMRTAAAKTMAERTVRHVAASTLATAAQSLLIEPQDGESTWMRVVKDVAVNTAFEIVGFPSIRKAWKAELGPKPSAIVTKAVEQRFGVPSDVAETKLTQVRGGAGIADPAVAETVLHEAAKDARVASAPITNEARKALDAYWNNIVPKHVNVNRGMSGVSFDVYVGDQLVAPGFNIQAGPNNQFARTVDALAKRVVDLGEAGQPVRFDNFTVRNGGTYTRFINRLTGKSASFGKMDSRELTEFEKNLVRAAPKGSVAESGVAPEVGTRVTVKQGDTPPWTGVVRESKVDAESPSLGVENPVTGATQDVPTKDVRVWLQEKRAPEKYVAHPDGTNRHIYIDLPSKTAHVEEVGAHTDPQNWFRTNEFSQIDREGDLLNGPRGFVHEDGNVTLSLTLGDRLTTWPDAGQSVVDRLDWIADNPSRGTYSSDWRTPSERVAHNMSLGDVAEGVRRTVDPKVPTRYDERNLAIPGSGRVHVEVPPPPREGPRVASWEPANAQSQGWQRDPVTKQWVRTDKTFSPTERIDARPEHEDVGPLPRLTAAARAQERGGAGAYDVEDVVASQRYATTQDASKGIDYWETPQRSRYPLTKQPLITDPALVDAKRSAEILLAKNMDPSTKVRLVVSDTIHAAAVDHPFDWTLEELAHVEPGLTSLPELRVASYRRGYKTIPEGSGVILRDVESGQELKFDTRIEAANFLSKQRQVPFGPKIEEKMNDVLRLGWMKSFDAAVDGGDFVPKEAQQLAMQTLVDGNRAGTKVWVAGEEYLSDMATRIRNAKATAPAAVDALVGEVRENTGLSKALRTLEQKLGVSPNTFRAMDLGQTQDKKSLVGVYNFNTTDKLRRMYGNVITKTLKVPINSVESMVSGLAKREAGFDILSHPDPESAIIYAHLKNTNQADAMRAGTLLEDPTTGRTYRTYPDEVKAAYFKSARERIAQRGGAACPSVL